MSIQPFIDPHPGRCKNIRPSNDGERDTSRRCLEMDGHGSACRFPPEPMRYALGGNFTTIYSSGEPKPWVVPENVECPTCMGQTRYEGDGFVCPDCTSENVEEPCEWCDNGFVEDLDNEGGVIRCPDCTPENVECPT